MKNTQETKSEETKEKSPKKSLKEKKMIYATTHRPLNFLRKSLEEEDYCLSKL